MSAANIETLDCSPRTVRAMRERIDELEAELRRAKLDRGAKVRAASDWRLQKALGLTATEALILGAIEDAGIFTKANRDDRHRRCTDAIVCKLRKKLRARGIELRTLVGTGYTLDPGDVERVREIMGSAC